MDNNWSIEVIQERAANNWSLEGDNQLLNLMKSISKNLEQRCMTSNNNLNRLMLDVDKTKIKLGNATTKLLDLNNAKFVEHTVMDMDSSLSNTEKCSTVENDKTFVPLPKAVEQAVTNGLHMMDRCYEKVLLNLEDSDEDENENAQKHVVCRPRNPYLNRPLPHLIGSKQWNDKWHIGLIESDEEVLSDEEQDEPEFSQSSSEDGDSISPQTSNPPTTSESDFVAPISTVIPREDLFHQASDDVEQKSPLFTPDDNKHFEKIKVLPTIVPTTQKESKNESINKSKQLTEPSVPSSEQPKQTIFAQQKPEQKFLNLFDDEPPLLDEPIQNERKPANLFLDSDDEEDVVTNINKSTSIFNNNVSNRPTIPFSMPPMDNAAKEDKSKDAFHGDVDNNNVPVVPRSEIKSTSKSNDFGGLFDDEPPDDFFDIIVREKGGKVDNKKTEKPKAQTKTLNLFESDDDDDDDFSKIIGTTKKNDSKVPAVSLSSKANIVEKGNSQSIPTVTQIEKSDVSHSPYYSPYKSIQNTGPPKSYVSFLDGESPSFDDEKPIASKQPSISDSGKNLFDDLQPDDTIVSPVKTNRMKPQSISDSGKNLFDDLQPDDTIVSPVKTNRMKPPSISDSGKNLFDDLQPDDTIVSPVKTNRKSPSKIIYDDIAETLQENAASPPIISSISLFDEARTDNIIVPPVALPRKSQSKVIHDNITDSISSNTTSSDVTSAPITNKEMKLDDGQTEDETDQSLSFKKNLSIFSNPEVAKLPTIEKDIKPKPNKLKTNFNINVAALLPGAKLPSQKQLATAKQDRIDEPEQEKIEKVSIVSRDVPISISNVSQINSTTSDDKSGRLTCLSKNRVKIKVQRKPSTRTGRQNLYTKSLIDENEDVVASVETTDSINSKEDTLTPEQDTDVEPSENISKQDVEEIDWLSSTTTNDQLVPQEPINLNVDDDDEEEDWLKNIDEIPASPSKTILYEEDDWLSTKVSSEEKPLSQNLSHVMNYDWLTASSLPPEDINPPSSYLIDDDHEQDDWLSSYVTKEKSSVVTDLPNDEADWLGSSETQELSRKVVTIVANAKEEEEDWLLKPTLKSEANNNVKANEDNDDWFTNSLAQPKASTGGTDKMPVSDVARQSPPKEDLVCESSDTIESNAQMKKHLKAKLFDSDDDNNVADERNHIRSKSDFGGESSNIFESKTETKKFLNSTIFDDVDEVPPTKTSSINYGKTSVPDVSKQSPPKLDFGGESSDFLKSRSETKKSFNSKLFDDDDDDDDLFTSTIKQKSRGKETNSNKIETVKTTKNVSIKATAKSLFSDDDNSDTDDLFGTTKSTKPQKGKIETGKKLKADKPVKTGLFDDEDDDDEDIFSSKTQKQRIVQADTKKKPSITKLVATIPASNDPLADLLK